MALALCFFSPGLGAQDSVPLSPDTVLIWKPTTPLEEFVSQTLRPLLEEALESSRSSDARLSELEQQIETDRLERQKERIDWQEQFTRLENRADRLQSFFSGLSERLMTFSGDEEEQYRLASEALDGIQKSAAALEIQMRWLKAGCWILGTAAVIGLGYTGGHLADWW